MRAIVCLLLLFGLSGCPDSGSSSNARAGVALTPTPTPDEPSELVPESKPVICGDYAPCAAKCAVYFPWIPDERIEELACGAMPGGATCASIKSRMVPWREADASCLLELTETVMWANAVNKNECSTAQSCAAKCDAKFPVRDKQEIERSWSNKGGYGNPALRFDLMANDLQAIRASQCKILPIDDVFYLGTVRKPDFYEGPATFFY